MRNMLALSALAALISLPMIAGPTSANASCEQRKNTGTLLGGVGGALIGNSISKGAGGAIIGGLGGAVVGHEIAKSGCGSYRHAYYRGRRAPYSTAQYGGPTRRIYYDQYGNAVLPPAPTYNR
ncbi:glycine zipper 2TM domain-containing protein [Phenylobacterium sp.]|jgi:hypothetical protein|uniref:glycine zipper 2TM domain-containing protein n=1 Tax=Phenylobacterium sp. TaxID=1871053 RepID=UPI001228AEA6|nr:glycine zipper 2TM domain-containing protein [Phenylobacterium sp.]THD57956.1 MAG: glycine zipper 2TM domain-containing protein [Phenylobacterium sp.]